MKLKVIFAVLFCAVIVSGNVFAQTFKRFEVKEKTGDVLVLETKTIPATVVKKDEYGRLPKVKINCVKWWEISEEKRSWSCTKTNFPEQIPSFEVSALPVTDDNVKKVLAWANNKNTKQNYKYKKLPNHANDIEAAKIFAWCNAFSESRKLEPVYYDADGNVIRNGESDDIYIVKIKADANGYRVPFISECYAMGAAGMKFLENEIATVPEGTLSTGNEDSYGNEIQAVYNYSDNIFYAVNEWRPTYNFYVVKNR